MPHPLCRSGTCETGLRHCESRHTNPRPCITTTEPFHMPFTLAFREWLGLSPIELSLLCLAVPTGELQIRSGCRGGLPLRHAYLCVCLIVW